MGGDGWSTARLGACCNAVLPFARPIPRGPLCRCKRTIMLCCRRLFKRTWEKNDRDYERAMHVEMDESEKGNPRIGTRPMRGLLSLPRYPLPGNDAVLR